MTHIERIRRKLGINQTTIASWAEVAQSTVSRWERGEGEPSLTELRRIFERSGGAITPADFFTNEAQQ